MKCGCTTTTCGCCEGVQAITPIAIENRPGLPAICYRVGTHGSFFETMQARLSTMGVGILDPVTGVTTDYTPLTGLTTRNPNDPAIALLDGWATVADVLTFYQERIANEGYLGTATQLLSITNLAALVGYEPRPGVASSVYLAFTINPNQADPVDIPPGTQAQSVPGAGQLPQTFETSDDFEARVEWNNLQVQLSTPQVINVANVLSLDQIYVSGTSLSLNPGDKILLLFSEDGAAAAIRTVAQTTPNYTTGNTAIQLNPLPWPMAPLYLLLLQLYDAVLDVYIQQYGGPPAAGADNDLAVSLDNVASFVLELLLGSTVNVTVQLIDRMFGYSAPTAAANFKAGLAAIPAQPPKGGAMAYATQAGLISSLVLPTNVQPASSAQLQRSFKETFAVGADVHPRLLQVFAPALQHTLYTALSKAAFDTVQPTLVGIYSFGSQSPLFGSTAAMQPTYTGGPSTTSDTGVVSDASTPEPVIGSGGTITMTDWTAGAPDTDANTLFLAQPNDAIAPGSYVYIQDDYWSTRQVQQVQAATSSQRNSYGLTAKTTQLTLTPYSSTAAPVTSWNSTPITMADIRQTLVYGQTNPLTPVAVPVTEDVSGTVIDLDQLYDDLQSGRYIMLSGERTDIPGVTGVTASELLMVTSVLQVYDDTLPGSALHSQLILATPTAYTYSRSTVQINANVVQATNGATKTEVLGSGSASQTLQSFTLKQPPLTFVPATNPQGAASTLQVYVNGVEWLEAPALPDMGPKDHEFITQTIAGQTTVIFGDGEYGARLPTGVQNVVAQYRSGIGSAGNVDAGQISQVQAQPPNIAALINPAAAMSLGQAPPLGIQAVTNPAAASGGTDPEDAPTARVNAPLAVMALDRLVSVEDYAQFSQTFAGIGKAASLKITNGLQQLVHVTVAGVDDAPIDTSSALYTNLVTALQQYGIIDMPVQVDPREMLALVLSANVAIDTTYIWDLVVAQIRASILAQFGFANRQLGQSAVLSQIQALIQSVPGVVYVDVKTFGGIPDRKTVEGVRVLLTPDDMAAVALKITSAPHRVNANLASFKDGVIIPAQIAVFSPNIPETLILNQTS